MRFVYSLQANRSFSDTLSRAACSGAVVALLAHIGLQQAQAGEQEPLQLGPVEPQYFSGDLRDLPRADPSRGGPIWEVPKQTWPRPSTPYGPTEDEDETPLDEQFDSEIEGEFDGRFESSESEDRQDGRRFPRLRVRVPGISFQGGFPPDTVGEIGRQHYIQMVNASVFAIYDKNGNELVGPTDLDSLWDAGGACADGAGDPIVLYDHLARRWLLSEFASTGNHLCVYVSASSDPVSGGWFLYDFETPEFPDYPKYAVWPDAYYVSTNESDPAAYALQRLQMLRGAPAAVQRFTAPSLPGFPFQALIPSDLDGARRPPRGSPNFFMRHVDDEVHNPGANDPDRDFLEIWEFQVDFDNPANSRFDGPTLIAVAEFDSDLCGLVDFFCFPQPGTSVQLDPLREVIMWRLQYRNFGRRQTLVGNFVTDVDGTDHGGIRWFELRRGRGAHAPWRLFQEGTFAPDGDNRWMGSIAMDRSGNIALGYSVSSGTTFPSIRLTGRRAGDPRGVMTFREREVISSRLAQTASTRWGDYSSMNVDPRDDCTFWYTNEFVASPANGGQWGTRIASFRLPGCRGRDQDDAQTIAEATPPN